MKNLLITGGTVFVSKYTAKYFLEKGYRVFVLNRGSKPQIEGVELICADRNNLNHCLKQYYFDCIIDVCAYKKQDIENLLNAVGNFNDYIFISSSAVYPETNNQPFSENQTIIQNKLWGQYSIDKIEAEKVLHSKVPNAYIIRPPYLYGPMQNLYREPFVFECAMKKRKFYIPKDGKMKLQFSYIEDLCKVIEAILLKHPEELIFNIGNTDIVDINTFAALCYEVVGTSLEKVYVTNHENQRDYFCFADYEYSLDITRQSKLLANTKNLLEGLKESFDWYVKHQKDIIRKEYIDFIDRNFVKL